MSNELISIIVPIYNSQKYLKSLFKSIDKQTYKNYELILINDGSSDKSEELCKQYLKKNSRAKYFYKNNSGVSDTRNYGIEKAKGNYICFIDSDDIVNKDYLLNFVDNFDEKNTLICCECQEFTDTINFQQPKSEETKIYLGKNKFDIIYTKYAGYSVNKIFKTEIIKNNNIYFDTKISMCEDLLFVFEYLKHVEEVKCISNANYYYRIFNQSASKNLKNEKWFSIFKAYELLKKDINLCSDNFKRRYYFMYNYYILYAKYRLRYIKKSNNYQKIKDMVNENYDSIKQTYKNFTLKQKIKIFIYKYFNYLAFNLKRIF